MKQKEDIRRKAGVPGKDSSRDAAIAKQAKITSEIESGAWGSFFIDFCVRRVPLF